MSGAARPPIGARRLDPRRPYKPLDTGNGLIAASVHTDGRFVAIGTYHATHGWVMLAATPPLRDSQRHDPDAVRAYRARLAAPDAPAFGLSLQGDITHVDAFLLEDTVPHSRFGVADLEVRVTTWALRRESSPLPVIAQRWLIHNAGDRPVTTQITWSGDCSLGRAAYSQLTERGPLPPVERDLRAAFDAAVLALESPSQGVAAVIAGLPAADAWTRAGHESLPLAHESSITVAAGATTRIDLLYAISPTTHEARDLAAAALRDRLTSLRFALESSRRRRESLDRRIPPRVSQLIHRARTYPLDCCAVPVGESLCLLTDHMILPLSWTRDAYYVLQALRIDDSWPDLLRRHLLWLFEVAQRPSGFWGRAYLANGYPKDQVCQLDQQCYPLLELADFDGGGGDQATLERLVSHVPAVLAAIRARESSDAPLVGTDETPADDPMPLPYHFSSQVLLWHTLRRLDPLNRRFGFSALDLAAHAEAIKAAIMSHFAIEHEGRRIFAYASDLRGNHHAYHDANDLPTVLAPLWGFCDVDDPVWRATIEFALSGSNIGGYYPGRLGGLGSIHTPAPWPLGDAQELIYARLTGDRERADATIERLIASATWDGALPEARDVETGAVRSRHWFAWPGAALVAAQLREGDS
jgi:uncharacterized protein